MTLLLHLPEDQSCDNYEVSLYSVNCSTLANGILVRHIETFWLMRLEIANVSAWTDNIVDKPSYSLGIRQSIYRHLRVRHEAPNIMNIKSPNRPHTMLLLKPV